MGKSARHIYMCTWVVLAMQLAGCGGGAVADGRTAALVDSIDASLPRQEAIVEMRTGEMRALRASLSGERDYEVRTVIYEKLAAAASHIQLDSALAYHTEAAAEARARGDTLRADRHAVAALPLLSLRSGAAEVLAAIAAIDTTRLAPANLVELHRSAIMVYVNLLAIGGQPEDTCREYLRRVGRHARPLIAAATEEGDRQLHTALVDLGEGRQSLALASLRDYLTVSDPSTAGYAYATALLTWAYQSKYAPAEQSYRTALLALADVRQGRLDGWALGRVAQWAAEAGKPRLAFRLLTVAEENAARSGARASAAATAQAAPAICRAYGEAVAADTTLAYVAAGASIAMLIVALALLASCRRRLAALRASNLRLARANAVKEGSLGQLLKLCHVYMDKMDDMTKIVTRKLAAGQIEDLYHMARAGKIAEEQRQLLGKELDATMLHNYPTFISDVNSLMREGEGFATPEDGRLTPELRLLAFMRLGIDDSAMIARMLGLNVNTVYAYRTRLRNRAIDRDNFEAAIRGIGCR